MNIHLKHLISLYRYQMGIDPISLLLNCCLILNGILVASTSYFGFLSKKTPFDLLDHKKQEEIKKLCADIY